VPDDVVLEGRILAVSRATRNCDPSLGQPEFSGRTDRPRVSFAKIREPLEVPDLLICRSSPLSGWSRRAWFQRRIDAGESFRRRTREI